jgi:hypothetical protein
MGKFKRPAQVLMPKYNEWMASEVERRKRECALGQGEMADFDTY